MGEANNAGLCSQVSLHAVSEPWHLCLIVSFPTDYRPARTPRSMVFSTDAMVGNKRKYSDDGAGPPRGPNKRLKADGTSINNGNHEEFKIPILEKVKLQLCSYFSYL